MPTSLKFRAIFEKHGSWYVGYVPDVPGVNAQERTLAAARKSLRLAIGELAVLDRRALTGRRCRIEELEVKVGR